MEFKLYKQIQQKLKLELKPSLKPKLKLERMRSIAQVSYIRLALKPLFKLCDWLFPPKCLQCEDRLSIKHSNHEHSAHFDASTILCDTCLASLPYLENACTRCATQLPASADTCGLCLSKPPPFDQTISVFRYDKPISDWIYKLKYQEQLQFAKIIGNLISQQVLELGLEIPQAVMPVPSHRRRIASRGFNQSELIAKTIAKRLAIQYRADLIIKTADTPAQATLSKVDRLKAQKGAFSSKQNIGLVSVAIIDDVITTGSTIKEISKILKKNGVNYVQVWSFARR